MNEDSPINLVEEELVIDSKKLEFLDEDNERRKNRREKGSDINPAEVELFLIKTFSVDFDKLRALVNNKNP